MPSTTTIDLTDCCCTTCDVCNGKVLKQLTATIGAGSAAGCPGNPSGFTCNCAQLNGPVPLNSVGGCCWDGDTGTQIVNCTDNATGIPFTESVDLGVEVCISFFDVDAVVSGGNYCSAAPQTFYSFSAGHYYVIGTVSYFTVSGNAGQFIFVRDLGSTKPQCTDVHGDIPFAYWQQPGLPVTGDVDPETFPDNCCVLTLAV